MQSALSFGTESDRRAYHHLVGEENEVAAEVRRLFALFQLKEFCTRIDGTHKIGGFCEVWISRLKTQDEYPRSK